MLHSELWADVPKRIQLPLSSACIQRTWHLTKRSRPAAFLIPSNSPGFTGYLLGECGWEAMGSLRPPSPPIHKWGPILVVRGWEQWGPDLPQASLLEVLRFPAQKGELRRWGEQRLPSLPSAQSSGSKILPKGSQSRYINPWVQGAIRLSPRNWLYLK